MARKVLIVWLPEPKSALDELERVLDWLVSTRAVLIVIAMSLGTLAVTTLTDPNIGDLPAKQGIAMISGFGAGAAIVAAVREPTVRARRLIGAVLMACALARAVGFGARNYRAVGFGLDWFGRANPVVVQMLAFYFGFVVWGRARQPLHVQHRRREGTDESPEKPRSETPSGRSRARPTPGLRSRSDLHRPRSAYRDVAHDDLFDLRHGHSR